MRLLGEEMERQRSFSYKLLKPKSLLLLSFASSSLLFSLLFSLFALRIAPFRLPFAASPGNFSTNVGNASSLQESFTNLEGTRLVEAGDFAVQDLGSAMGVEEVVLGGVNGSSFVKDSILVKPQPVEGSNFSKGDLDSAMGAHLEVGTASASEEAATSVEKLEETKFGEATNLSMQATDSTMEANQLLEQWKSSDLSTAKNISEATSTPVHSKEELEATPKPIHSNEEPSTHGGRNISVQGPAMDKPHLASRNASKCNVYDGRWVFDESYPLYASGSCPFIDEAFGCGANGREDRDYMKWRWQPQHCNIPRFNAWTMLDMLRGKRLVFVGDSINRNQWESMMCLLREAVSDPTRIREARGRRITKERGDYSFQFLDYNCTVEYHVTHFLVHESKARIGQKRVKTLRIDTVDRSSSRWRGADVLVFNTAHWWSHHKTKAGVNYYQEGDYVHPRLDASTAFRRALTTWASWVDRRINPRRTRVFFRSSSPSHFSGGEWNSGGHCRESSMPLADTHARPVPERSVILEQVVREMKTPVTVLNITNLSGLRIDGHPSVYGRKLPAGTPSSIQDCSHWCLPGVPDTWNELLFYHLISSQEQDLAG